jgi:hypothetical protein
MINNRFSKVPNLTRAFILQKLACLLLAAFLFGPVEAAAPTGAFVWYKFDSNVSDAMGNTIGAVQGGITTPYPAGRVGQAFKFDGANAVKISQIPASGLNFGTLNFTIAAWVKFDKFATGSRRVIYQNGYALNSAVLLQLETNSSARFFIRDENANAITVTSSKQLNDNAWHYIVGVRSEKSALLYVDGILQSCQTNQTLGKINASCKFGWIGGTNTNAMCGAPANDQFFNGLMDEFFIVKRDLPGSEIMKLYLNP